MVINGNWTSRSGRIRGWELWSRPRAGYSTYGVWEEGKFVVSSAEGHRIEKWVGGVVFSLLLDTVYPSKIYYQTKCKESGQLLTV